MRRFLLPIFLRPFPVFFVPTAGASVCKLFRIAPLYLIFRRCKRGRERNLAP